MTWHYVCDQVINKYSSRQVDGQEDDDPTTSESSSSSASAVSSLHTSRVSSRDVSVAGSDTERQQQGDELEQEDDEGDEAWMPTMKRLGDRRRPVIKSADTTRNDFHDQTLQEDEDDIKALREQVKSLAGTSPSAGPTPGASLLPPRDDATGLADIGDSGFSADVEDSNVTSIQTGNNYDESL